MQKRWFAVVLACVLLLAGCGGSPATPPEAAGSSQVSGTQQVTPPEQTPTSSQGTPDPQEPAKESASLAAFRAEIGKKDAVAAVAYLNYVPLTSYEELTAYLESSGFYALYPFLTEVPEERFVQQEGGDLYAVVPAAADIALTISRCDMEGKKQEALLRAGMGEVVILQGNVSEVVPNLWITAVKNGETLLEYTPSLSRYDGSVFVVPEVWDFTDYEHLYRLWEEQSAGNSCVSVHYAADVSVNWDACDWVIVDETVPIEAAFCSMVPVENFAVVSLSLQEDGSGFRFDTVELYEYGTLTPERPLRVILTDYGTIPSYGISFTDPDGNHRLFGVTISGEDGALELVEIS